MLYRQLLSKMESGWSRYLKQHTHPKLYCLPEMFPGLTVVQGKEGDREIYARKHVPCSKVGLWEGFLGVGITWSP